MMTDDTATDRAGAPLARKLATILCADVAGYSQMMGADEERTVRVFRGHREIFEALVKLHCGRIFNTAGDALLAEFNSAVEAVRCATEIQTALRTRNEHLAPEEKMLFRMGVNLGDVIVQGNDLLGDGVNVAARIQTATEPGGICISGSVYDQIQNKLSLDFKLLGEQTYKNIAKPVRTYTINEGGAITTPMPRRSARMPAAIAVAALVVAGAAYWGYQQYDAQRGERLRVEAQMAAQLATQKQATEQAQRAADDARRDALMQAQKQAAEDSLRRAQEERGRVEQDRKMLESEKRAAEVARKQAADDAARRAQEESDRLAQERKLLDAEKRAVAASSKPPPAAARAGNASAAKEGAAAVDGTYNGRLCNYFKDDRKPVCWPVELLVRNGLVEGRWLSRTKNVSKANGTVAADGLLGLKLSAWTSDGIPIGGVLTGRVADKAITATGKWADGGTVGGNWKRTQ